jgi:hypothetical protein
VQRCQVANYRIAPKKVLSRHKEKETKRKKESMRHKEKDRERKKKGRGKEKERERVGHMQGTSSPTSFQ